MLNLVTELEKEIFRVSLDTSHLKDKIYWFLLNHSNSFEEREKVWLAAGFADLGNHHPFIWKPKGFDPRFNWCEEFDAEKYQFIELYSYLDIEHSELENTIYKAAVNENVWSFTNDW